MLSSLRGFWGEMFFFFLPESRLRLINIIALYRSGTLVSQRWILEFVIILDWTLNTLHPEVEARKPETLNQKSPNPEYCPHPVMVGSLGHTYDTLTIAANMTPTMDCHSGGSSQPKPWTPNPKP